MTLSFPALRRALVLSAVAAVTAGSAFAQEPGASDAARPLLLHYERFDPAAEGEPEIAATLKSTKDCNLWIVQFNGVPSDADRQLVADAGGEIVAYQPHDAYVVRMQSGGAAAVSQAVSVRWIGSYHPAYRLEPFLVAEHVTGADVPTRRYNIVVADKTQDKPGLMQKIAGIGGRVTHPQEGSILLEVALDGVQLLQAAQFDEVLWIDRWTEPGEDVDDARVQGGANYVEAQTGFTGQGLVGYVYEGIETSVADFNTTPVGIDCGTSASHGHSTATIIFGNGAASPQVRGFVPDASAVYTNYSCDTNSRFMNVQTAMNVHGASFKTASWGGGRTLSYTSESADTDDIIYSLDIAWSQSQSNAGNQMSRPQAWAKNVFSIGGFDQFNNADPADDSWAAGGGSTGPAADGRIKPTLAAYYRNIATASISGGITQFSGTSGATPIVAGHNALAIEMFARGTFASAPQRVPGGTLHQNRPHFTTLKALQVASSSQYQFTAASTDNRREHVGYGFPNLRTMYANRNRMVIVDETDVLATGQSTTYNVTVQPGDPELRVALNWAEQAANPAATQTILNNLSLRVTSPGGTTYWGNNGLSAGNYNTTGGSENTIDTLECVFVSNPAPGQWTVEVIATSVVVDNHVETGAVDADYGLVIGFGARVPAPLATLEAGVNGSALSPGDKDFRDGDTLTWDVTGPVPVAQGQPAIVFINTFSPSGGTPSVLATTPGLSSFVQTWSASVPVGVDILTGHIIGANNPFSVTVPSGLFTSGGDQIRIQALYLIPPGQTSPNDPLPFAESNVVTFDLIPPPAVGIVMSADNGGGGNAFSGGPSGAGFWQLHHNNPTHAGRTITRVVLNLPGSRTFDVDGNSTAADGQFDHGNGGCSPPNPFVGSDVTTGLIYAGTRVSACNAGANTGWNGLTTTGNTAQVEFRFNDFQFGEVFHFDADVDGGSPENGNDMAGTTVLVELDNGTILNGLLVAVPGSSRSEAGL